MDEFPELPRLDKDDQRNSGAIGTLWREYAECRSAEAMCRRLNGLTHGDVRGFLEDLARHLRWYGETRQVEAQDILRVYQHALERHLAFREGRLGVFGVWDRTLELVASNVHSIKPAEELVDVKKRIRSVLWPVEERYRNFLRSLNSGQRVELFQRTRRFAEAQYGPSWKNYASISYTAIELLDEGMLDEELEAEHLIGKFSNEEVCHILSSDNLERVEHFLSVLVRDLIGRMMWPPSRVEQLECLWGDGWKIVAPLVRRALGQCTLSSDVYTELDRVMGSRGKWWDQELLLLLYLCFMVPRRSREDVLSLVDQQVQINGTVNPIVWRVLPYSDITNDDILERIDRWPRKSGERVAGEMIDCFNEAGRLLDASFARGVYQRYDGIWDARWAFLGYMRLHADVWSEIWGERVEMCIQRYNEEGPQRMAELVGFLEEYVRQGAGKVTLLRSQVAWLMSRADDEHRKILFSCLGKIGWQEEPIMVESRETS